ncbi:hypothetical protein E4T43_06914 [Aureobasidium subglaciale]|nr:hypothetical protein E4T43_06914 [Aureobasidium subglaciale]
MHLKPHRHVPRRLSKRDDPLLEFEVLDDSLDKRAQVQGDVATVFSVVYVTASATFSGPTAGFVTLGADPTTSAKAAKSTTTNNDDNTTTAKAKQTSATAKTSTTSTSSAKVTSTLSPTAKSTASTSSAASSSTSLVSSSSVVLTTSAAASSTIASSSISSAAKAQATSSASASASAVADETSSGISTGAKAGIALMVIVVVGLLAGLAYFLIRKKKAQQKQAIGMQRLDDEKKGFISNSPSTMSVPQPPPQSTRSSGPAPRISYRPGSQFSASVLGDAEKAALGVAGSVAASRNSDPSNPFGIHAQTVESQSRDVISPIPEERSLSPPVELQGSPVPSPTAASFNIDSPTTPSAGAKAEVGMASVVPVAALAGGASGAIIADPPGSTVHRVQLEFKPSMDDELELKVGQIVRVLHEYDDGWALCMKMDRSQQGVAPRTCLSKLPLKPRPTGPPPGAKNGPPRAAPRAGPGAMGPPPRPIGAKVRQNSSSSQGSAASSQQRRPSMAPSKPSSPTLNEQAQARQRSTSAAASPTKSQRQTQQRVASAAEAHSRSASMGTASSVDKSTTASGATTPLGVPTRKPVPGQAL